MCVTYGLVCVTYTELLFHNKLTCLAVSSLPAVVECFLEPLNNGYPVIHAGEGERLGYGAKVTYACNEGFQMVAQSTRVCQLNGTWNGTQPHCKSKCAKFSNCSYLYGVLLSCILLLPS